jgi:hypothetical protein
MISRHKNHSPLTNDNLWSTDFARSERIALIDSVPKPRKTREAILAPGLSARGIWMTDVSAMDRRSVKAQLAGRGDFRADWWNLNAFVHRMLRPGVSMEQVMQDFQDRQGNLSDLRRHLSHHLRKTPFAIGRQCFCLACKAFKRLYSLVQGA